VDRRPARSPSHARGNGRERSLHRRALRHALGRLARGAAGSDRRRRV
jgi:hypothetical protein